MLRQNNHGYFNKAPNFEHDHYNHNGPKEYDDRMFKEKIEAPTFDSCLDLWVFTNWLRQMEKFFNYYHWAENKKVRYVRIKLIGRADLFCEDLEDTLRRRHDDRMFKEKIEAPTFDSYPDLWVFTNWLRQMEKFFDYYHWAENKKVRYARIKLIGRADLFCEDLEDTLRQRHEPPIID